MPLGKVVGLGPGHIMLDWDPAPPPKRGTPNFQLMSVVAKQSPIPVTAEHTHTQQPFYGPLSGTTNTQRVRSWSEDRRARPEGSSSSSVAPTTTAGSLSGVSAPCDGPPEADPISRRRRGGHKTPNNVTSHPLRPTARHFGPFPTS